MYGSNFTNKDKAFEGFPWMSFSNGKDDKYRFKPEAELIKAHRLALRSYEPEVGRRVLLAYTNFNHAISRNAPLEAHDWIQQLDGQYPDIDRRNELREPTKLVRALARRAMISEALDDIGAIERSLEPTQDLLLRLWPANQRRYLGFYAHERELIQSAIDSYEQTYQHRKERGLSTHDVEARIVKARAQIARSS